MDVSNSTLTLATSTNAQMEPKIHNGQKIFVVIQVLIVTLGFLGNMLILVVMCNKKFHRSSTSIYLSVLAISDTLMLLAGPIVADIIPFWFGIDLRNLHISLCCIFKFLIFWTRHLSSWCLVSITVERMIAVLKPHK